MTAHTPGPWESRRGEAHDLVEAQDGPLVCFIASSNRNPGADARLIAAAPDLLSVAYAALDVGERIDHDPDSALGELVAAALAAIAKATGASDGR